MSYQNPATKDVLALLEEPMRTRLMVWQVNHGRIWDWRVHSVASCPFFYTFDYFFKRKSMGPLKWAARVHDFYEAKHREEDNCPCDSQAS